MRESSNVARMARCCMHACSSLFYPCPPFPSIPPSFSPSPVIKESVVQSVQCQLEVACCQCPRLSYLTDSEILKVASNSGNPVSIIPLISKIFPAVHNLKLIEVSVAANDPTHTEQGMYCKAPNECRLRVLWYHYNGTLNMQYPYLCT